MCGRFNVIDNPGLQELLQDLGIDLTLPEAVNVAPTEQVSLVRRRLYYGRGGGHTNPAGVGLATVAAGSGPIEAAMLQ